MPRPAARRPRNRVRGRRDELPSQPTLAPARSLAPALLAGAAALAGTLTSAGAATIDDADRPPRSLAAAFERAAATPELFADPGAPGDGDGSWGTAPPRPPAEQSVLAEELAWWAEDDADAPGAGPAALAWWRGAPTPPREPAGATPDAPPAALAWWAAAPAEAPAAVMADAPIADEAVTPAAGRQPAVPAAAAALAWWAATDPADDCERLAPTVSRAVERPEDVLGPRFEDPNPARGPCMQPLVHGAHLFGAVPFGTVPRPPWWAATRPYCMPATVTPDCPPCRQFGFAANAPPPLEAEGAAAAGSFLLLP
ncbi:hypothetical protein [Alienimonas sp. DA493]|uniref:hypothetical protein n=1 Tax=Alienimonas sp. DA493 TaxID=3373605 RepID=UPI003754D607